MIQPTCPFCDLDLSSLDSMPAPMRLGDTPDPYPCPRCGAGLILVTNLADIAGIAGIQKITVINPNLLMVGLWDPDELLSTATAARILGVGRGHVDLSIARGLLGAIRVGKRWRVPRGAITVWRNERRPWAKKIKEEN